MTRIQLPLEIEVEDMLADGIRYRLPGRKLGGVRLIGWFLVAFGLFFSGFAVFWMAGAGGEFDDWFDLVFAAFGLPFFIGGLMPVALGAFVLYGRSEVRIEHGKLLNIERAFPFRWSWSRNLDEITQLSISRDQLKVNGQPVTEGPLANLSAIAVKTQVRKPLLVAPGYPRDWLRPLAEELAQRCEAESDSLFARRDKAIEVVEEKLQPDDPDEITGRTAARIDKPPQSDIAVERFSTGVTLTVPPPGLRCGSKGLFSFSLFWNAFIGVFTVIIIAIALDDVSAWWVLLFLIPFWAVGIWTLLASINMGRRNAVLAVVDRRLMILQTGLFGTKRRQWQREDVKRIRSGPTGASVNDVPIMELQVTDQQGKTFGVLSGREPDELAWMAFELLDALEIGPE